MRVWTPLILLTAAALAGCADTSPPIDDGPAGDPGTETPLAGSASHAAYGYLTSADLEEGTPEDFPAPGAWNATNPPGPAAWKKPAYRDLPDALSSMEFMTRTSDVSGGAGIAIFGPLALAGPTSGPLHVINIMDPAAPTMVGKVDAPARDVDTILYPDGRLIAVTTGGGGTMTFVDITDPYDPWVAGQLSTPHNNHNLAVVPGTPIVYNSPSSGSYTDIVDASDPESPQVIKEWENGYGCHDMTFYMNAAEEKFRAYCAGLDQLQIWDLADVTDPEVISEWGWPAAGQHDTGSVPLVTFAHLAIPNHDASILILGDETGGGAAPGCDFSVRDPVTGTTATGPLGNLWFYDITDESSPVLQGSVSASAWEQRGSCTAHFGRVIEDTDHVVVGFYSAGVLLVDFTDPENPYVKDRYENQVDRTLPTAEGPGGAGSIWDVWYYQGYLFTGDTRNGVDVLTLA